MPLQNRQYSVFIGSFTKRSDYLDLWRAYGSNGKGFCLVTPLSAFDQNDNKEAANLIQISELVESGTYGGDFSSAPLQFRDRLASERASKNFVRPQIFNVAYSKNEVRLALDKIDPYLVEISELKANFRGMDERSTEIIDAIVRVIVSDILYLFKNEIFSTEEEVRIVFAFEISSDFIKRDTNHLPSRLFLETKPFLFSERNSKIIVGPRVADKSAVCLDLEYRLSKQRLSKNTTVSLSTMSYR